MNRTSRTAQHAFQQREWTDRRDMKPRQQPLQGVDQTFPCGQGPAAFSSLPSRKPSIKQRWSTLCLCGRYYSVGWTSLVFQRPWPVWLPSHQCRLPDMTQPTGDQPRRLELQREDPSLQRGFSILHRVPSVLLSDRPGRPRDKPGRPWDKPRATASPGNPDHVPHSLDPRQWSLLHEMSLQSTSLQRWTRMPREPFLMTRKTRVTVRRSLQRNIRSSDKLWLHQRDRTKSTLLRQRERPGPLCWTWVIRRWLTRVSWLDQHSLQDTMA